MADRIALSLADTGLAGFLSASKWTGIRVGDVISSTVPWVKANPVIAPHVLRLTSALPCCLFVFLRGSKKSLSSHVSPPLRRLRRAADGRVCARLARAG